MVYIIGLGIAFVSLLFVTTNVVIHENKKIQGVATQQIPNPSHNSPTVSLSITKSDSAPDDSDSEWKYPNSTRIDLGHGNYYYKSSDDPKAITDWYKKKVSALSLNLQTVITNTSNGNIINTIKASDNHTFITVIIEKEINDTSSKISLKIVTQ